MGGKFYQIKFILVLFMSLLALSILYISNNQSFSSPNFVYILTGVLFIILGNFFKVIQPNYFLGIRTPWTLESPEVWKLTHVFAGKLWFIGGIIMVLGVLIFENNIFHTIFTILFAILILIPIVYSYVKFKEIEKKAKSV